MGIVGRYTPSSTSPESAEFRTRATTISAPALVSIVLFGTLVSIACLVFFGLWLSRRRAERKERRLRVETASMDSGDVPTIAGNSGTKKLKKSLSSTSRFEKSSPVRPRRRSMPRVFSGPLARRASLSWSTKLIHTGSSRKNPSWIDADALHGPEVSPQPKGSRRSRFRDSWPLGNRTPTIPKLHHTVHGYPYEDRLNQDALFGIDHVRSAYGQLRIFSRVLPEPPRPAIIATRDRQNHPRTASSAGNLSSQGGSQGAIYQPIINPIPQPISPVRSLPKTPSRPRVRQSSTDSTLSEILRSTEKRLQDGTTSRRHRLMGSPSKMGTSRESLLDHSMIAEDVLPVPCPPTQPKTPSPKKHKPTVTFAEGHRRQQSDASATSESDSLLDELLYRTPDCPSGLTSPSRNPQKQDMQTPPPPVHSSRSSVSSTLSTVYSEDERSEGRRTVANTPDGAAAENIKSIMVSPESMADPFSPEPRQMARLRWPGKQHKEQDLFRESLVRSQRLRRMTLGQTLTLPPEVRLPPCPVASGRRSQPPPHTVWADYSSLRRPEPIAKRSSQAKSSSSKVAFRASQAQPTIGASKLSTIILPPPTVDSRIESRPGSPCYSQTSSTTGEEQSKQSPSRTSTVSPKQHLHSRTSIGSSIYSQDHNDLPATATALSRPASRASRLTPSPGPRASTRTESSLAATVAELRRMNSCVSTTSSLASDNVTIGTNGSPNNNAANMMIHPVLRDAVFSPSKHRSGSQHYLSLGGVTPPRHSHRGSKVGAGSGHISPGTASLVGSPRRVVGAPRVVSRRFTSVNLSPSRSAGGKENVDSAVYTEGREIEEEIQFKMPVVEFTFAVHEDTIPVSSNGSSDDDGSESSGVLTPGGNVVCTPAAKRRRYESKGSQESLGLYDKDGFLISSPVRYGGASPVLQVC